MKVVIVGNQDNLGFRLLSWMHRSGYDCELIKFARDNERSEINHLGLPDEHQSLSSRIHSVKNDTVLSVLFPANNLRDKCKGADVVFLLGFYGVLMGGRLPGFKVILSTGPTNIGVNRTEFDANGRISLKWEFARFLIRRAVKSSKLIFVHYEPEISSLKKIRQLDKARLWANSEDSAQLDLSAASSDFEIADSRFDPTLPTVAWLSRVIYRNKKSAEYKGTDKFLMALKHIKERHPALQFNVLVGFHGVDAEHLKRLANELAINENIIWIPHLPSADLQKLLRMKSLVLVDELTNLKLTTSGIMREALAAGVPLVKGFDLDFAHSAYSVLPPVYPAHTANDVARQLREILISNDFISGRLQQDIKQWAANHARPEVMIEQLFTKVREVKTIQGI